MIAIPPEGSSFGRMGMKKADVQVPHNSVSGMHARVFMKNGAWYLEDLGSSNGTFVGNDRVESPVRLTAGMRFSLSRYKYEVVKLDDGDGGGADAETGAWGGYPAGGPDTGQQNYDDGRTSSEARFLDDSIDMSHGLADPPQHASGGMGLTILILIVVIALGGVVVWLAMPESEAVDEADDTDVVAASDIEVPGDAAAAEAESAEAPAEDAVEQGAAAEGAGDEGETAAAKGDGEGDGAAEGGLTAYEEYQRKLGEVEATLKKKPKLLKKKAIKSLYKSLQKKQKKIKKKYKKGKKSKKVSRRLKDAELFKETGPIVDKLHRKLF